VSELKRFPASIEALALFPGTGQLWEAQSRGASSLGQGPSVHASAGTAGVWLQLFISPTSHIFPALVCLQQPHKAPSLRKLPVKKDMKEQEKGDGSDGKESLKTKSDESGEEKNGDDDNQKSAQKKKGEAGPGGDSALGSACLPLCDPQPGGSIHHLN